MAEFREDAISIVSIESEMRSSYLDYAMSVIASRALPDVRDGLKPVHRRILYAQSELSNEWNRAYKKSARIVGDVMGKYHPHGDSAIYDSLVRMAQDFSLGLPLEDGQGNFGSMDGDKAAAMRYTEVRMSKAASFMLKDIDKDTVDFKPNYDGHDQEPTVLPARFPNLLVNGTSGIAVGMATNIPPHNLGEMVDATIHLVDNPNADIDALCEYIQGPDFPTGGIVLGKKGIHSAMRTGRGSVVVRGRTNIETYDNGRQAIIVTEMPYQVNKAKMVERIAEMVKERLIEGISDLRDESSREGVRVVVELKRDAHAEVVLAQLLKHTPLQNSFSYNMLALDHGRPKLMNVKDVLQAFIDHREEVIRRRTKFELNKARARAHVLVGLATAVANIDDIIKIVRNAPSPQDAKDSLMAKAWPAATVRPLVELLGEVMEAGDTYKMSAIQAQAILDLRLHRLTGLERDKINAEADEIAAMIRDLVEILSDRARLLSILKEEVLETKELFAVPRRSDIEEGTSDVDLEDLIKKEEMVVTISSDGYVKRQPMDAYRAQRRGGKGKSVANMKNEEEQIQDFFVANTHVPLLFFTTTGKVYTMKVYEIPVASAGARGKAFINLLPLEKDERVMRVVPVPADKKEWEGQVLMFATADGLIRKTPLIAFNNVYANGIKGITLNEGDQLVNVRLAPESEGEVLISSAKGQAVRFSMEGLRTIASRTAAGIKGITLKDGDKVVSMDVVIKEETPYILTVTENGFGKRTEVEDFPVKGRGTMGVIAIKTSDRNGKVVASMPVADGDQVMMVTSDGQVIRMGTEDVSVIGRNTQGVTLFKTGGATVFTVSRIKAELLAEDELLEEEGEGESPSVEVAAEAMAENAEDLEVTDAE